MPIEGQIANEDRFLLREDVPVISIRDRTGVLIRELLWRCLVRADLNEFSANSNLVEKLLRVNIPCDESPE